ncbi:MAG: YkgJ family cysteine cluster protein [Acidimicrobiia bacterium]|nr:YkgJ family cysteine cluster protein [Acidimicrobiia bacterium]
MSGTRAAGDFGAWLAEIDPALRGDGVTDVPCEACTACCTSSQFIHVGPDETDTLAHIPPVLLFPAPGRPSGHLVMGYDDRGWCPMLSESGCTIYDHRPQTCRSYDCRVFAAAGVVPDAAESARIADRTREWAFAVSDDESSDDRAHLGAIRAAARFLRDHAEDFPPNVRPANVTGLAVVAIEIRGLFLERVPTTEAVGAALAERTSS